MRKSAVALLLTLIATTSAYATQDQVYVEVNEIGLDQFLDLVKADVQEQRAQIVGEAMALNAEQSARFWPIYAEYEKEAARLADEDFEVIKDYAQAYDSMTDAKANELAQKVFTIDQGRLTLRRLYYDRITAELGAALAARFLQIDNQITMLLDLQIASQLPLVEKRQ